MIPKKARGPNTRFPNFAVLATITNNRRGESASHKAKKSTEKSSGAASEPPRPLPFLRLPIPIFFFHRRPLPRLPATTTPKLREASRALPRGPPLPRSPPPAAARRHREGGGGGGGGGGAGRRGRRRRAKARLGFGVGVGLRRPAPR
ncbi:hypothetical protein PVAP13_9KG364750 [Panicum virgatum]|uniref:Uncharacterized protein n=1 Tax=Panicum virgatum TaxID=38727 RepID=A0A8T0NSL5_PANVG|nr:hypothetical protein PVAP13_9KG364750 [Panicum virgatum]